jgi:hypothetical protein
MKLMVGHPQTPCLVVFLSRCKYRINGLVLGGAATSLLRTAFRGRSSLCSLGKFNRSALRKPQYRLSQARYARSVASIRYWRLTACLSRRTTSEVFILILYYTNIRTTCAILIARPLDHYDT